MKKILSLSASLVILILSCSKKEILPNYTPPSVFSANSKMSHNMDSVNLTDTIIVTAKGVIADTTNSFATYLKTVTGSVNSSGVFTSSGILVDVKYFTKPTSRVFTAPSGTSTLYNWTATYLIPVPMVAHKTNILITGYFENSLSLNGISTDNKTDNHISPDTKQIYVR